MAKNERMMREDASLHSNQQTQQILEAKDEYLLNEIMVLKAEFHADMHRLNENHRVKEAELLVRLEQKDRELAEKATEVTTNEQTTKDIASENKKLRDEMLGLRSKNDCIVTDMYRMNEELYQHWMTLRDIKLLTSRNGQYLTIRKLYEDIGFNDHLFSR